VTDAAIFNPGVAVTACPPDALLRLDLWAGPVQEALPRMSHSLETPRGRLLGIEPAAWLLRSSVADETEGGAWLENLASDNGAVTILTGGLARFHLEGPRWRELLTINAVFDVEDPAFGPGRIAATILNHAAIWIDVITDTAADVYCLPSYAQHLAAGWRHAIARMG